jgi:hypothetical protein
MYIDHRPVRRTTVYSFYPPNVFDMTWEALSSLKIKSVHSSVNHLLWFALIEFKNFFLRDMSLPGRIACQKSHKRGLVDLIGMSSRPYVDSTFAGMPWLSISTQEVFRVETVTVSWLSPMKERLPATSGGFFWEDLRFVEVIDFGGVTVIHSTRQTMVVVLYDWFTDGFGLSEEEFIWHKHPEKRVDTLLLQREEVSVAADSGERPDILERLNLAEGDAFTEEDYLFGVEREAHDQGIGPDYAVELAEALRDDIPPLTLK